MFVGDEEIVTELLSCSRPEEHAKYHEPEQASFISVKMRAEMIQAVSENPICPVKNHREKVVLK